MIYLNFNFKIFIKPVIYLFTVYLITVIVTLAFSLVEAVKADKDYDFLDLPHKHLPYYFNSHVKVAEQCYMDEKCPHSKYLRSGKVNTEPCWGYEPYCSRRNALNTIKCSSDHSDYVQNKESQLNTFYHQADFGYIKDEVESIKVVCEPLYYKDSALECTDYHRFCRGRNIMFNFTDLLYRQDPYRYKIDVLKQGQIGGFCKLHSERLDMEHAHISALQSWAPELRFFEQLTDRPIDASHCDIVVTKPTIIMKIDAENMYHRFCDFFNLYASLHVNMSNNPMAFDRDVQILIWETFTYESQFSDAFKAFTKNPILDLKHYKGKVVCFQNLMLPLLPRMIFGLYYNTFLQSGCENSALFHSFSEFMLHRLKVQMTPRINSKIRITFLSRGTRFRNMLNEDELFDAINTNSSYEVRKVTYGKNIPFVSQLAITRNTDVFIGMHGAGLTHLLFLPNWASLFEVYNCEDPTCYRDLARLRGVYYVTWEDESKVEAEDEGHHPEGGGHKKFTNYRFDKDEFVRLVAKAADHVLNHPEFPKYIPHDEL